MMQSEDREVRGKYGAAQKHKVTHPHASTLATPAQSSLADPEEGNDTKGSESLAMDGNNTLADSNIAADNMPPKTQKVQVSIVRTKDVAQSLPSGYVDSRGNHEEVDTATKIRPAAIRQEEHVQPVRRDVYHEAGSCQQAPSVPDQGDDEKASWQQTQSIPEVAAESPLTPFCVQNSGFFLDTKNSFFLDIRAKKQCFSGQTPNS